MRQHVQEQPAAPCRASPEGCQPADTGGRVGRMGTAGPQGPRPPRLRPEQQPPALSVWVTQRLIYIYILLTHYLLLNTFVPLLNF